MKNDIASVAPGQTADVQIDALGGEKVLATVDRVDQFGTDLSGVMVYYVYLTVTDTDTSMRPGMTTQVDIITQQKKDILIVPNRALKAYQGEKAVQIMDQETQTLIYKPVTIGIVGDTDSEVVSGLSEGETIVVGNVVSSQKQSGGFLFGGH